MKSGLGVKGAGIPYHPKDSGCICKRIRKELPRTLRPRRRRTRLQRNSPRRLLTKYPKSPSAATVINMIQPPESAHTMRDARTMHITCASSTVQQKARLLHLLRRQRTKPTATVRNVQLYKFNSSSRHINRLVPPHYTIAMTWACKQQSRKACMFSQTHAG